MLIAVVQFIVFLTFATLICRGTDISKCFRESLGIRDNESRLYIISSAPRNIYVIQYKTINVIYMKYMNLKIKSRKV